MLKGWENFSKQILLGNKGVLAILIFIVGYFKTKLIKGDMVGKFTLFKGKI